MATTPCPFCAYYKPVTYVWRCSHCNRAIPMVVNAPPVNDEPPAKDPQKTYALSELDRRFLRKLAISQEVP